MVHRGEARTIAKVGEDHLALSRFYAGQPSQLTHEKRIRQPMKTVTPYPKRFVASRDRQQVGDSRQFMVKGGVETRHLRQVREATMKRLGQQDLFREMLGIEWAEPV